MASLPTTFPIGSVPTSQSVRDAIASYRRAQYFVAGSTVTASDTDTFSDDEEEGRRSPSILEEFEELSDDERTPRPQDDFAEQFEWDEEVEYLDRPQVHTQLPHTNRERERQLLAARKAAAPAREHTPLLRKAISFTTTPHPRRQSTPSGVIRPLVFPTSGQHSLAPPIYVRRRLSASSAKSGKYEHGGKSTFGQTLFNSTAILLGIGMLSEPLAFAYSGWMAGTALVISYGFISCYTAKILARIILTDPRLRSYADIGRKAFGPASTSFIGIMFCLELFAVSVILVTLYADSLHTLIPRYSTTTYKLWGLLLLIPTVFLPLPLLSYTSILGIVSSVLIIFVVFIDGLSKPDTPGSIWSAASTSIKVENWNNLGIAFGLFMAGFSGHAVIPSLARDMIDPSQFDKMINWAFIVATMLYTLIGYAGYMMFGTDVSEEISINLLTTPGYNPVLNKIALWMLVISPLSKFALTTQPLNATIEILIGVDIPIPTPEDMVSKSNGLTISPRGSHVPLKRFFAIFQRVTVTVLSVLVSIMVPDFSSLMAFLGSFSAFMLCVIGPISAKVALAGHCGIFDGIVVAMGIMMALWGTVAAFLAV
ncbi:Vacuolar amino acid transporter 1 [Hypsizygus marmoreus]|uniref:Vacuolar amino acid transporter 1 n=1 Tax=Hypsizygus marmoreus TaxID=39966 RepID=A0A369K8M3_HYPMA|nr:Vacuolar amino acid transporter 1 [Hypsizygus marmoreus]